MTPSTGPSRPGLPAAGEHTLAAQWPAVPDSIAAARTWIRQQMTTRYGCQTMAATAALLISELATNTLLHTATTRFALRVDCTPSGVVTAVHDDNTVAPHRRTVEDEHGRGLALVQALSPTWGTYITLTGKWVWCSIPHQDAPAAGVDPDPGPRPPTSWSRRFGWQPSCSADLDELARTRRISDLQDAAVLPDRRAERRRRLAEPDQRPTYTDNPFRPH